MTERHPYEFKLVKAGEICINPLYQRKAQTALINDIVNNFDYHQVNPVKVVFRDGQYWAFDGQQTTAGLYTKFGEEYLVPCMVYYDIPTWIDEAKLFEQINLKTARKAVNIAELWKSRQNRNDEKTMDINAILEENGLRSGSHGKGAVRCLETLDKIWDKYGRDIFAETIQNLASAFDGDPDSLLAPMLMGMAIFVNQYRVDGYDRKKLVSSLHRVGARMILKDGMGRIESGRKKYADAIRAVYNASCRGNNNRLPPIK